MLSKAVKKETPVEREEEDQLVPFNFRIPKRLVDRLDVWLDDLNKERPWPKLTRSALLRDVLDWGERERPAITRRSGDMTVYSSIGAARAVLEDVTFFYVTRPVGRLLEELGKSGQISERWKYMHDADLHGQEVQLYRWVGDREWEQARFLESLPPARPHRSAK